MIFKPCLKLCVVVLLGLWLAGPVNGMDWPAWRGPGGDGVSRETGWNAAALKDKPPILWKYCVGRGHSAVVVKGNLVFTMGENVLKAGAKSSHEEVVYCLDTHTGKVVWRYAYPCRSRDFPGPAGTPTIDGDYLYTAGREGDLYCFHNATGRVIWKRNLVAESLSRTPQWGFCASPVVDGDLLLVNAGKSGLALNKKNGRTVWASAPEAGWLATPVLFTQEGKHLAAISALGTLYAVEVASGKVLWTHQWASDADPTVLGTRLYLLGGSRGKGNSLLEMDKAAAKVVWETRNMSDSFQSSVILGGHAFGFGRIGRNQPLACIDIRSGDVKWSQEMGEWGALMAADGKLIILNGEGELIIAKASPTAYEEISRTRLIPMQNWRSSPREAPQCCWTAPVLANGRIFARDTYGNLVCVDMSR